jgi:leader peptidase (prepilin peptidase)/N-methyltransferase
MRNPNLLIWGLKLTWLFFVFAYGACIGSLINVVVYRRPRGISIVTPPSRCPSCNTRLSWRDNIPVLGWLLLRGRCRYCQARISPEYPIVEAAVGLLFCLFFFVWYMLPDLYPARFLGLNWMAMVPDWARNDASVTWPTFLLLLILLSCLVAMTIIDARTFTIPLELTWIPAAAAILIHPIHAAFVGMLPHRAWMDDRWGPIPTPGRWHWDWVVAAIGGLIGLGIGLLLLRVGLIRRSFADYSEWEKSVTARLQPATAAPTLPESPPESRGAASLPISKPEPSSPAGVTLTPAHDPAPADLWIQYPHARREMIKELAFLAPAAALFFGGLYLGRFLSGLHVNAQGVWALNPGMPLGFVIPVWVDALSGALLGYLIGGGLVWGVRILGSLAFGKEAMGLGDVHLMAAVGACLGWIDSTLAFFGAAFVGLAWVLLGTIFGGGLRRTMPYGPYLAVSTVLVQLGKPLVEAGLSRMFGHPVNLPP